MKQTPAEGDVASSSATPAAAPAVAPAPGVVFATRRERRAHERRMPERRQHPGAQHPAAPRPAESGQRAAAAPEAAAPQAAAPQTPAAWRDGPHARRGAHAAPRTARKPPLVAAHAVAARHRRRAKGGVIFLSMGFAAAMAVATSVPAASLPSSSPAPPEPAASLSAAGPRQSVTTGDVVVSRVSARDDFSVTSREETAQLHHIRLADTFTNDPDSSIQWPFPVGVPIASYFGPRVAPIHGASTFHEGVDFDPGYGVDVHAIADGVVRTAHPAAGGGFGVYVVIDHVIDGKQVSSLYGHMKPGSLRVHVGEHVTVGQVVGRVGNTGISTGPHMHFEILLDGTKPVDPYAWLKAHVA